MRFFRQLLQHLRRNTSKLSKTYTNRGFGLVEFADSHGEKCSLQKSSAASDNYVWLGFDDLKVKKFYPNTSQPWRELDFSDGDYVGNTRMHLNRDQVRDLLPYLERFVETGDI